MNLPPLPPRRFGPSGWLIALITLVNLAIWGGIGFVAFHFLAKWW